MPSLPRFLRTAALSLLPVLLTLGFGLAPVRAQGAGEEHGNAVPAAPTQPAGSGSHRVDRGAGELAITVPSGERLRYRARLLTALVDVDVGTVDLSTGIDPYRPSLLLAREPGTAGDTAWIRARAYGDYTLYTMDAQLETRFQPQDWPRLVHNYRHEGTEKRRRELLAGKRGDQWLASYRSDTKRGAPQGLRIWRPATEHPIPAAAVDSMGAVYLVRSMIVEGRESLRFPMLDKQRVWQVDVQLGAAEELTTPAGRFRGRPVTLVTTRIDPGAEAEAEEEGGGHFEGPFGIRGRIELWMEEQTGVPLVILGAMPVLGSDLQIDIRLEQFEGTPAEFVPLPAAPTR